MTSELKLRIITAVLLLGVFLAVVFLLPNNAVAVVFALGTLPGSWEWGGLIKASLWQRILFAVCVVVSCLLAWHSREAGFVVLWMAALILWSVIVPFLLYKNSQKQHNMYARTTGFMLGWLTLMPVWAAIVYLHQISPLLLLSSMGLIWVADIAAYFGGRAFGRTRLAPNISPGKTWEGAVVALVATAVYGYVLVGVIPQLKGAPFWTIIIACALATVFSIAGDLFESLMKRRAGVKDSGRCLPGHGGVLDRIDGLSSALPLIAILLFVFS